ncbi:MAG TPA: bifunctional DNA-formamidopyrimidine glycosylase/DNA-(apurinic or apyrimidinic site) lyase [Acidimicrobiales bacterium]|nr:bifunctional DNA-formamidopyrimidine glycosylase/DNA-(apurinic or apyrimidinic site) lyase [Acidimicrobiales bacterium]
MPELPEVETVRRDLASAVLGARVAAVTVTGARSVRRQHPDEFARALTGARLDDVSRWGKYLLVALDSGQVLVAHLRMSGQLLIAAEGDDALKRHTHVRVRFSDGRELRFVDPRTFGELFVTSHDLPELSTLGVDALGIELGTLAAVLRARRGRLKPLLLDQRATAGIGNIYSDEILWAARLRWYRRADQLRPVEVRRLHEAMTTVLDDAIAHRGSSLGDAQYVDLAGRPGGYQERHAVYGREGQACLRCGRPIERTIVAQRSHFWCRACQR